MTVKLPATPYRYIPSIDHGTRIGTEYVVIHDIEGSAESAENYFKGGSRGVGAHVIIGTKLGQVVQTVPLENKCWHAVQANTYGIGFEHEGHSYDSRRTWIGRRTQRVMSANRAAWCCYHFKLGEPEWGKNIRTHASGGAAWGNHNDPGPGFPVDLYMAAAKRAYKNLVRTKGKKWSRF